MSSITWWNRLEPYPRDHDLSRALEAQVRDPVWFMTRQWQLGEYRGEDAASPSHVEVTKTTAPFLGVRVPGGAARPIPAERPLEELTETEPFTADLSVRVELGQTFEALLRTAGGAAAIAPFRAAFTFTGSVALPVGAVDPEGTRFARICDGRAIDGYELYRAQLARTPGGPDLVPGLADGDRVLAEQALTDFVKWVQDVYGGFGVADAETWRPERLEYAVEVIATRPAGSALVLAADPDREATFDWYAFDERPTVAAAMNAGTSSTKTESAVPNYVRFRGMPNHRFWDFESGQTSFGGIEVDTRDLARLGVASFLLTQSNDWFLIPIQQDVSSLCRIDSIVVHDVFGGTTLVERADRAPTRPGERWTMFSTSIEGSDAVADYFVLPPSAGTTALVSRPVEIVNMLRDETANLAFAVETATENAVGAPWSGHERNLAEQPDPAPAAGAAGSGPSLAYQVQSPLAGHWIPLIPMAIDAARGRYGLAQGAVVRVGGSGPEPSLPRGRILNPSRIPPGEQYRIAEEEVSRIGTRVTRHVCMSRWIDGSTHLWIARRKTAGTGEGSSNLAWDKALPR
jgi:hypothetical protein